MKKTIGFLQSKGIARMYVEKRHVLWLTLQELLHVGKRTVFANTLQQNEDILREIGTATPRDWEDLVAKHKNNVATP
jgi:hypothetical protein